MRPIVLLPFVLLLGCAPILAQDAPTPVANSEGLPTTDLSKKNGDLSDKLKATDGVIRPDDNIDPAMRKTAPAEGSMPVIPPPGSPGGQQGVEPK